MDDFVCFERDAFERVPGCAGSGERSIDYCTKDFSGEVIITEAPVAPPVMTPAPQVGVPPPQFPLLTDVGDDLGPGLPLGLCEGMYTLSQEVEQAKVLRLDCC